MTKAQLGDSGIGMLNKMILQARRQDDGSLRPLADDEYQLIESRCRDTVAGNSSGTHVRRRS